MMSGKGMMGSGGMMGSRGMMGGGGMMRGVPMMGGMGDAVWTINGTSMTGDGQPNMPPLFTLRRGQTCVLLLRNETASWHPMHLHGHGFRVITQREIERSVGVARHGVDPATRKGRNCVRRRQPWQHSLTLAVICIQ